MKRWIAIASTLLLALFSSVFVANSSTTSIADPAQWPQWRGPFFTGMARTGAPTEFSETKNVKWKVPIAGRGFSTPVVWGDKIFLATAVPTGKAAAPEAASNQAAPGAGGGRRGPGGPGGAGAGVEHKFVVMALDRKTGKTLWEREAKTAVPHEGHHPAYGSFASNAPVTDGKYLYASFGSRGIYCYDLDGKLIWERDLVQMRIRLQFGEGSA